MLCSTSQLGSQARSSSGAMADDDVGSAEKKRKRSSNWDVGGAAADGVGGRGVTTLPAWMTNPALAAAAAGGGGSGGVGGARFNVTKAGAILFYLDLTRWSGVRQCGGRLSPDVHTAASDGRLGARLFLFAGSRC